MASRPILVGVSGSEQSLRAVNWAAREAVLRSVPLRIALASLTARADLLVLGRHTRPMGGTDAPLGPVIRSVLGHARGPVAVVPDGLDRTP